MIRVALALFLAAVSAYAQDVVARVVEDATNAPLAGAEFRFRKAGVHELAADLDSARDGTLRATGLAPGDYTLEVRKDNFISAKLDIKVPVRDLQIRLVRFAVIAGHVRDSNGKPLPGRILAPGGRTAGSARIAVLTKQPGSGELQKFREAMPNDSGAYRVYDLPPGQYALGLFYTGLPAGSGFQLYPEISRPRFFTVAGSEDYRDIDFTVVPSPVYSVSGKIDLPAPSMGFSLALNLPNQPALPLSQALTDKDGTFQFTNIPNGDYNLVAAGPQGGYGVFDNILAAGKKAYFGRTRISVGGQNLENIVLPVSAGRTAKVILHSPSGKPPEGCPNTSSVNVTLAEPWGLGFNASALANFETAETVSGLPPARLSFGTVVGAGCYQVNHPILDLTSGDSSGPATIELASAGHLKGTLRSGSDPATEFTVVLVPADGAPDVATQIARPDQNGRFAFDGLRPGNYRIAASRSRWIADVARMIEIEIAGGSVTEIDLPVVKGVAQ